MQRKLLIRVLEIIERETSYVPTGKIAEELGIELNGELLQIVNYLIESKKIKVIYENYLPVIMNGAEQLKIFHTGIDFLTELKLLQQKENSEKQQGNLTFSVSIATIVLALASFIEMGINLIMNGKNLLVELGDIKFLLLIIILSLLFSFMGFLLFKSYKVIHQKN